MPPFEAASTEPTYHVHNVEGRRVRVCDTLGDFLLVRQALEDELLDDIERFHILLAIIYPDPQGVCDAAGENVQHFLYSTLWECFGIDIEGVHETDENRVLDWDEDRERMIVTSRTAYQMGWDSLTKLPYKEACVLMILAPHETPMGQAIYYRLGKPPKETKYNKEQIKAWKEAKRAYALRAKRVQTIERANAAADADFRALAEMAKAAKHG